MNIKEITGIAYQMVIAGKKLEAIKMLEYYDSIGKLNDEMKNLLFKLLNGGIDE